MPPKKSILKPSGYDAVIRNRQAIRRINARLKRASTEAATRRLIDEKDLLMREMWAACPHQEIAHCDGTKTSLRPEPIPMRFCTGCGESELAPSGTFNVLKCKRGRQLHRFGPLEFSTKLGRTLIATGINMKDG